MVPLLSTHSDRGEFSNSSAFGLVLNMHDAFDLPYFTPPSKLVIDLSSRGQLASTYIRIRWLAPSFHNVRVYLPLFPLDSQGIAVHYSASQATDALVRQIFRLVRSRGDIDSSWHQDHLPMYSIIEVVGGQGDLARPGGYVLINLVEGIFTGSLSVLNPKWGWSSRN